MRLVLAMLGLAVGTSAAAQETPRFCPNRPTLGASGCTTEPGRVQIEMSGVDWQRDDDSDEREDIILAGDIQARIGVGPRTEVQVGWAGFGHVRTRDKASGRVAASDGVGDVRLAVRQNLSHPDGEALSIGLEPFVTLPVGRTPVGAGDWAAGIVLPISYAMTERWSVAVTGEIRATVDADGDGRHLAYGGIVGAEYAVTERVMAVAELALARDDDPNGQQTRALAAGSIAWQPGPGLQLDVLAVAGLNRTSPDFRLVTGAAILF